MNDTVTVEIPADVRDNSETVTDYAFMRHRSPDKGVRTPGQRDDAIRQTWQLFRDTLGYRQFGWFDHSPNGQRCRFDVIINSGGSVVHLFHTEYYTRTACAECVYSYASVYQVIQTEDGMSDAVPRCDEHAHRFRRAIAGESGVILHESERLLIGQHD